MTIGDILVNTNRANLNNLLPLSEVKTKEDFAKFKKKGYTVVLSRRISVRVLPSYMKSCPFEPW